MKVYQLHRTQTNKDLGVVKQQLNAELARDKHYLILELKLKVKVKKH
jgi:hypothetical protein